jgi:hypothetical protein
MFYYITCILKGERLFLIENNCDLKKIETINFLLIKILYFVHTKKELLNLFLH